VVCLLLVVIFFVIRTLKPAESTQQVAQISQEKVEEIKNSPD